MNISSFQPTARLRPYVSAFLLIESEAGACNKVLPDTALVLALRLRGQVNCETQGRLSTVPAAALTGLCRAPRLLTYAPHTATLLVKFTAEGAAAFFPMPLHEVAGLSVPIDELWRPAAVHELRERLCEASSHAQRIAVVEALLLAQLREVQLPQPVQHVMQEIRESKGTARIGALVAAQPMSRDSFGKVFRRLVGTSPKQYAAIVRLREVLTNRRPCRSGVEVAYGAGYFDQAHFIHDFKRLTGMTPARFATAGEDCW